MKIQKNILEKLVKNYFYLRQALFEEINRPAFIGVILLIFKYYILIQISYFEYYENHPSTSPLRNIQKLLLLYQLENIKEKEYNQNILSVFLVINSFILFILFLCYSLNIIQNNNRIVKLLILIIKYPLNIYSYGFGYISAFISLKFILKEGGLYQLAYLNYILTSIIIIIVCAGDHCFSYSSRDFLQRRNNSIYMLIQKYIDQLGIFIYFQGLPSQFLLSYTLANNVIRSLITYYRHPFIKLNCQQLDFSLSLAIITIPICLLLNSLKIIDVYVEITPILLIPLTLMVGIKLFKFRCTQIIDACYYNITNNVLSSKKRDLNQLPILYYDIYCRFLCSNLEFYFTEYSQSPYSSLMESIIQQHGDICYDYDSCFCSHYNNRVILQLDFNIILSRLNQGYYQKQLILFNSNKNQDQSDGSVQITEFLDYKRRKQYINSYVKKIFTILLGKSQYVNETIYFNYYKFLKEEIKNNNILLIELQRYNILLAKQRMGISTRSQINIIIELANQQYTQSFMMSSNTMNSLDTIRDLKSIIKYDEYLIMVETTFSQCIKSKKTLLNRISQQQIDLNILKTDLGELYYIRNQLEKQLLMLSSLQIQSTYLKQLCNAYSISFKFDERFSQNLKKLKLQRNRNLQFLIEEGCGFFISLTGISLGNIIRTTRNFSEVANTLSNGVGKNISFLIPQQLQKNHEQLLKNFLYRDGVDNRTFNKPLLIGCDEKGWAFPFELKYQLTLIDNSSIGLACHLKKHSEDHFYVSVNLSSDCQVITISQKLYKLLFSEVYNNIPFNQIKLSQQIPLLIHIIQEFKKHNNSSNKIQFTKQNHETLLIKPSKINNVELLETKQQFSEYLMKCDIYLISIGIEIYNRHFMEFMNISFDKIQFVSDQSKKLDYIMNLSRHLTLQDIQLFEEIKCESFSKNILSLLDLNNNIQNKMKENLRSPRNFNTNSPANILISSRNGSQNLQLKQDQEPHQQISDNNSQLQIKMLNDIIFMLKRNSPEKTIANFFDNSLNCNENLMQNNENSFQIVLDSDRSKTASGHQELYQRSYSCDQAQSSQQLLQLLHPTSMSNQTSSTTIKSSSDSAQQIQNIISYAKEQNTNFGLIASQVMKFQSQFIDKGNNNKSSNCQLSYNSLSTIKESEIKSHIESRNHTDILETKQQSTATGMTSKLAKQKQNYSQQLFNQNLISKKRQALTKYGKKNNGLFGVQVINFLEYLLLFAIGIMVFNDFIVIVHDLEISKQSFEYINWMSNFNGVLSISNSDITALELLKLNFYEFKNQEQKDQFQNFLNQELSFSSKMMNAILHEIYRPESQDLITFQRITHRAANQKLYSTVNQSLRQINSTFIYEQITQAAYLHLYSNHLDPKKISQKNAELNFQPLNSLIYQITMSIDSDFRNNSEYQKSQLLSRLLTFASVSLVIALSFYPSHKYIIGKQQQILILFSTFDSEMIRQMNQNLNYCQKIFKQCSTSKRESQEVTLKSRNLENQTSTKKNKNISKTIPLKQSPYKVLSIVFLAFIILQAEPITQFIISSNFFEVCSQRYSLTVSLLNLQSILTEILQAKQSILLSRFYPENSVLEYSYYQDFAKKRSIFAEEDLLDFQKQLQMKEIIQKFNRKNFDNFFFKALETNACEAIKDNQEYYGKVGFDYNECIYSHNGIMNKGMIIAIQDYIVEYQAFQQLIFEQNEDIFQKNINNYIQEINILDEFIHRKGIIRNLEILINFLKINNNQQYVEQILLQKILISWQLVSISILFLFGFLKYFQYVKINLQQSKRYLNLIETVILLNNPYICSYLKQNL